MLNYIELKKSITKQGAKCKGIVEIKLKYYNIYVYEGKNSQFDIIVKYKNAKLKRERMLRHIQWVVDLLLKMQAKKKLTRKFLAQIQKYWEDCLPLKNNDFETIKNLVESDYTKIKLNKYNKLNNYGQYDVEFLYVLFILLIHQEKTNNHQAYMFKNVIDQLLENELDIYKIVAIATHGGKR